MNKTSLLYWLPFVKESGVPYPETSMIKIPEGELIYKGNSILPPSDNFFEEIKIIAKQLGYPIFMRTDHCSAKHYYSKTCYVQSEENLKRNIHDLIEFHHCADLMGIPYTHLVFRKFMKVLHFFKAFDGLPIGRERRYFVENGKVLCHHPYWPEYAMRFYHGSFQPKNWKNLLKILNKETDQEVELLTNYAEEVSQLIEGSWSIDFCMAENTKWFLIDMAESKISWHPDHEKEKETITEKS